MSGNVLLGALEQDDTVRIEALEKRRRLWWDTIRPRVERAGIGTEYVGLKGDDRLSPVNAVAQGFSTAWIDLALLAARRGDATSARAYAKEAGSAVASFSLQAQQQREWGAIAVEFTEAVIQSKENGSDPRAAAAAAMQKAARYPPLKTTFDRYLDVLSR